AVGLDQPVDGGEAAGEVALYFDWRNRNRKFSKARQSDLSKGRPLYLPTDPVLCSCRTQIAQEVTLLHRLSWRYSRRPLCQVSAVKFLGNKRGCTNGCANAHDNVAGFDSRT